MIDTAVNLFHFKKYSAKYSKLTDVLYSRCIKKTILSSRADLDPDFRGSWCISEHDLT